MKKKTTESTTKLRNAINERHQLQDQTFKTFYERFNDITENYFESQCVYHSECYKEVTNVTKLRRLSLKQSVSCDDNQVEPPEENEFSDEEEILSKSTRSKSNVYVIIKSNKTKIKSVYRVGVFTPSFFVLCLFTLFSSPLFQTNQT